MFNIADISGCISGLDRHRRDDDVYPFFLKKNYFFLERFFEKKLVKCLVLSEIIANFVV